MRKCMNVFDNLILIITKLLTKVFRQDFYLETLVSRIFWGYSLLFIHGVIYTLIQSTIFVHRVYSLFYPKFYHL